MYAHCINAHENVLNAVEKTFFSGYLNITNIFKSFKKIAIKTQLVTFLNLLRETDSPKHFAHLVIGEKFTEIGQASQGLPSILHIHFAVIKWT